jgi:O-antigen/teichoic acid export membrane protein
VRWTVVDQFLSSGTNFLVVAAVARTSNVETFGQFSLAYIVYGLFLGAGRATGGEILLLRAAQAPGELERDTRRLLGLTVAFSVIGGVVVALVSLLLGSGTASAFRALAVMFPALLVQDALRYVFFATGRPRQAFWNDLIWAVVQIGTFGALVVSETHARPDVLIFGWAGGAAVAALVGLFALRLVPHFTTAGQWITRDLERVTSFFADFVATTGAVYLATSAIGLVSGLSAVAALRGAMLLFAPFAALVTGFRVVVLQVLARSAGRGVSDLRRSVRSLSLVFALLAAAWSAIVLALPDSAGEEVLGATWHAAEPLLIAMAITTVARNVSLPMADGLRALGAGVTLVALRSSISVLIVGGAIAGAGFDGARGAADGIAIALGVGVVLSARAFRRASAEGPAPGQREASSSRYSASTFSTTRSRE